MHRSQWGSQVAVYAIHKSCMYYKSCENSTTVMCVTSEYTINWFYKIIIALAGKRSLESLLLTLLCGLVACSAEGLGFNSQLDPAWISCFSLCTTSLLMSSYCHVQQSYNNGCYVTCMTTLSLVQRKQHGYVFAKLCFQVKSYEDAFRWAEGHVKQQGSVDFACINHHRGEGECMSQMGVI